MSQYTEKAAKEFDSIFDRDEAVLAEAIEIGGEDVKYVRRIYIGLRAEQLGGIKFVLPEPEAEDNENISDEKKELAGDSSAGLVGFLLAWVTALGIGLYDMIMWLKDGVWAYPTIRTVLDLPMDFGAGIEWVGVRKICLWYVDLHFSGSAFVGVWLIVSLTWSMFEDMAGDSDDTR